MMRHSAAISLLFLVLAAPLLLADSVLENSDVTLRRIRIIYTSDTLGVLEPCGCGGQNAGGLVRRSTVINSLRRGTPGCVVVDSGNLMPVSPCKAPHDQRILNVIADALKIMGYDAVGVGKYDLPYGEVFHKALKCCNVETLQVSLSQPTGMKPYTTRVVCGTKVGVVSFGATEDAAENVKLARARYAAFADARKNSEILVLLDQSGTATDTWLQLACQRLGGVPDIVIGGTQQLAQQMPELVGQTMIAPTCSQGLFVGCVDVLIDAQGAKRMTYTKYDVTANVERDPLVQTLVDRYYSPQQDAEPVVPVQKPFLSYAGCRGCHQREYAQWQKTPHASALVTLRNKQRAVPLCLSCHSEKYRTTESLSIGQDDFQSVECASCHSDVLPHDSKPTKPRTGMKTKCLSCHNQERSPNFDYDKYIKLVSHKRK